MLEGERGSWSAFALAMGVGSMILAFSCSRGWPEEETRRWLMLTAMILSQGAVFVSLLGIAVESRRDRAVLSLMIALYSFVINMPYHPGL